MKTSTHTSAHNLTHAYRKSAHALTRDPKMTASMTSAGFTIPNGQKRGKKTGFQVFVKVARYSDELLKEKPLSGGLLEYEGVK